MSCGAISSLSSRTVYAASATTRSITSRSSSSPHAIHRSNQGNLNSYRYHGSKNFHEGHSRSLSSFPPQMNEAENRSILGLTLSAFITGGTAAAYVAYDLEENYRTAQCSSLGVMSPTPELSPATIFQNQFLRQLKTENSTSEDDANLKSSSFQKRRGVNLGLFNNVEHVPMKAGALDVVEASVNKACAWEKKAKAAVDLLRTPSRYDVSVRALRGGRLSMEDTYCIHDGGRFAGVFDGHGGAMVSKFISEAVYDKIKNNLEEEESTGAAHPSIGAFVKSISSAFDEIDDEVLSVDKFQYQGSTAVAVYVHEDEETKDRTIISANIGDSRAVLARGHRAVDLTRDHKPDDEHEKKRILAMGETIEWDEYCQVSRVKNLSLSRAIGDRFAKPVVSGEVEIQLFPLSNLSNDCVEEDDFIILGSDGLWDVMTSQSCVEFVTKRLNPSKAQARTMSKRELALHKFSRRKNMSRFVANEAIRRGSCDNISAVIIWLNKPKGL